MTELPKAQLLAYAVAGVLVVVAAIRLLGGGGDEGRPAAIRLDGPPGAAPAHTGRGETAGGARIYVHVAGAVARPGLYRVPPRSRVAVAIERAGGPSPKADLSGVNLAASLEDGQQVIVPRRGAGTTAAASGAGPRAGGAGAPGSTGPTGTAGAGAQISLATATAEQLDGLDGIGPTLAKRIIEYREGNGGFRSVAQLREVEGIGPKRFETLKQSVRP